MAVEFPILKGSRALLGPTQTMHRADQLTMANLFHNINWPNIFSVRVFSISCIEQFYAEIYSFIIGF